MSEQPRLSIIVPMYNATNCIIQNLNVLLEIGLEKEILVIDDGSTNDCYALCNYYYGCHSDIKLLQKKNGGVADARNFGLDNANGIYVMFVDQDDIVNPKTIEAAVSILETKSYNALFWSTEHLFSNGKTAPCNEIKIETGLDRETIIKHLFPSVLMPEYENPYMTTISHVWSGLYNLSFVNRNSIRFKRFIQYEDDFLFVVDVLSNVDSIYLFSQIGYRWVWNIKSSSNNYKFIDSFHDKYNDYSLYLKCIFDTLNYTEEDKSKYSAYLAQRGVLREFKNDFDYSCKNKIKKIVNLRSRCKSQDVVSVFECVSIYPKLKSDVILTHLLMRKLYISGALFIIAYTLINQIKNNMKTKSNSRADKRLNERG